MKKQKVKIGLVLNLCIVNQVRKCIQNIMLVIIIQPGFLNNTFLGNGKTHYIHSKMKHIPESHQVTVAVNEAFTSVNAIERLRTLPRDASNCAIFFNFTILPPAVGCLFPKFCKPKVICSNTSLLGWYS